HMSKFPNNKVLAALLRKARAFVRPVTRHGLVLGLLFVVVGGMVARAAYLQLIHKDLQVRATSAICGWSKCRPHRGMIVDRNGEPLAVSSPVDSIWAEPKDLLAATRPLAATGRRAGHDHGGSGRETGGTETRQFVYLRRHLAPNVAAADPATGRFPACTRNANIAATIRTPKSTSHLLGFTDIDDTGQEGLEKVFDSQLRGIPGQQAGHQGSAGPSRAGRGEHPAPQPGQQLTLSIDRRLQYLAYRALKAAVVQTQRQRGFGGDRGRENRRNSGDGQSAGAAIRTIGRS
ncbi:MAG: hypothetical protein MZV65_19830, partial [Chromatiales bacterium]|nr:hypothetical protein [Chromatiales bacterium]